MGLYYNCQKEKVFGNYNGVFSLVEPYPIIVLIQINVGLSTDAFAFLIAFSIVYQKKTHSKPKFKTRNSQPKRKQKSHEKQHPFSSILSE